MSLILFLNRQIWKFTNYNFKILSSMISKKKYTEMW
jgi:hypothetical protein